MAKYRIVKHENTTDSRKYWTAEKKGLFSWTTLGDWYTHLSGRVMKTDSKYATIKGAEDRIKRDRNRKITTVVGVYD